jgi:exodeoxyribonuclease VIII
MLNLEKIVSYDVFKKTPELIESGVFVVGMPNDDYHAFGGVSSSILRAVSRSPAHARSVSDFERSRAMEIGTAIHAAIFEIDRFKREYTLLDDIADRRSADYKNAAKAFGGDKVLTGPESESLRGMYAAVRKSKSAMKYLGKSGFAELSGFIRDPQTGVIRRVRFDWITVDGEIVDLKKTQDARPDAFSRAISSYDYHVQAAWYLDTFAMINGECSHPFRFLAVEEQKPHGVGFYAMDESSLIIGRDTYGKAYDVFCECSKTGIWPCYEDAEASIGVQNWVVYKWESAIADKFNDENWGEE